MRKLTNPWNFESNENRRAEYAEDARERVADYARRPIAAVYIKSTEGYRFYRVLAIQANGRHTGMVSDLAGAAYDGKRVAMRGGDVVEGPGRTGWLLRVNRDGVDGTQHVRTILSTILGGKPGDYDVTEF